MDKEIDLGKYVRVVFRHYRFGLLLLILVAGVIVAANMLKPPTYSTSAVLIAKPTIQQWRFESRIQPTYLGNKNWQLEFSELGKDSATRNIVSRLAQQAAGRSLPGSATVRAGRQTLLFVDAVASTPEGAADLANYWARAFVQWIGQVYGPHGMLEPLRDQLALADRVFTQSFTALDAFKAKTGMGIIPKEQASSDGYLWLGHGGYELAERNRQLAAQGLALANVQAFMDEFQRATYSASSERALEHLPWHLLATEQVIARGYITPETIGEHQGDATFWNTVLPLELEAQTLAYSHLETELGRLQESLTAQSRQFDQLVDEFNLSRENYLTWRRKVDEVQTQIEVNDVELQLIQDASAPAAPVPIRWPVVGASALAAGLVVGIVGCFAIEGIESRRRRG